MQFVTLQTVKTMLGITFDASDADLTEYINLAEGAILQHIGVPNKAALLEAMTGTEVPSQEIQDMTLASIQLAVRYAVAKLHATRGQGDIWDDLLYRFLMPYRIPGISPGTE